jgi:hypothetical protein
MFSLGNLYLVLNFHEDDFSTNGKEVPVLT